MRSSFKLRTFKAGAVVAQVFVACFDLYVVPVVFAPTAFVLGCVSAPVAVLAVDVAAPYAVFGPDLRVVQQPWRVPVLAAAAIAGAPVPAERAVAPALVAAFCPNWG